MRDDGAGGAEGTARVKEETFYSYLHSGLPREPMHLRCITPRCTWRSLKREGSERNGGEV
jgi:hypothetical protein